MKDGDFLNGCTAAIFDDCHYLASDFLKIKFEHNFQEANQIAHKLARLAKNHGQSFWLDDAPSFIIPLLLKDVTHVINE
jgi:hypothetical protein